MAAKSLVQIFEEASHIGIHKGNYGLRFYLSDEQQIETLAALREREKSREPPRVRCAECDNGVQDDWTYCPYCGAQGRTEKAA